MTTLRQTLVLPIARTRRAEQTVDATAPRAGFMVFAGWLAVLVVVLSLAIMGLNMQVVDGRFQMTSMRTEGLALQRQQQQIANAVAQAESPDELTARATALGMQPAARPMFLRLPAASVPPVGSGETAVAAAAMPH